jgi:dTMP kinase
MESQGKLIVLEGIDGSGKGTQLKLLRERLEKEGIKTTSLAFPQYGKKSSGPIEEYLNGKYGKPDEVNPYAASLFYAIDRFDVSKEIKARLHEKYLVVLDRYVDSNAGHQGGKIKDSREREKFIEWLYDIEYRILGIPKPDLVIILHVPAEIGQKLVAQKERRSYIDGGNKTDTHETDLEHLKSAEASYLWLAKKYLKDHRLIKCVENGQLLTPEEIHNKLWGVLQETKIISP